ncbi:MAG: SH3 domain-containing protein [Pseudomonadota bacterium]
MWRFVVISFAFLGMAFYVMSGGASYEPAPNSVQAQAKLPPEERINYRAPASEPEPGSGPEVTRTVAQVEATFEGLSVAEEEADELSVTLTTIRTDAAGLFEAEANRPKAELLNMALPEETFEIASAPDREDGAINAAVAAALGEISFDQSQIRWVKENIIDLRAGPGLSFDRVRQVSKGAEVAVLEDPGHGWLNVQVVDGYETGWVPEWLLTDPE